MDGDARVLVWDLPTRLFHWSLAAGFAIAATLALGTEEGGALFPYHAIAGLAIAMMVLLRIGWGFIGSRHARFRSFLFGPRAVLEYAAGVLGGRGARHAGHNPGSAWAIFAMLALVLALAATGLLLGTGNEGVKEIHEFLAYAMLAVVGLHVAGVLLHTARHRENITASMIQGRKDIEAAAAIATSHRLAAIAFLILSGAWIAGIFLNYDPAARTTRLPLLGVVVGLGEANDAERPDGAARGDEDD